MNTRKPNETALNSIDESRRDFFKKLVAGTAFAAPLLASFSMDGALLGEAEAQSPFYCGYTPGSEDVVFRAVARRSDNAVRFSAVVRLESDCLTQTVILQFSAKAPYTFNRARLFPGNVEIFEGQTQIVGPQLIDDFNRGGGKISVYYFDDQGVEDILTGDLVGGGAV